MKMWEVREGSMPEYSRRRRVGFRMSHEDEGTYDEGYEDGYRQAMQECERHYEEKRYR